MPNLKSRIDKLEDSSDGASSDALTMLVELVARRDALFWPWRKPGDSVVAVLQRRRDYLAGSVGIPAKADGKSNWKASHHTRGELIAGGLVEATYSGGQVTSMFITALGDAKAKSAVGTRTHTIGDVLPVLAVLQSQEGRPFMGRVWTSESDLFGETLTGRPENWGHLTETVLPLLVAGLVVSSFDAMGRVYYSATDEPLPETQIVDDSEPLEGADQSYLQAYNAERDSFGLLENHGGEIFIPIPASGW